MSSEHSSKAGTDSVGMDRSGACIACLVPRGAEEGRTLNLNFQPEQYPPPTMAVALTFGSFGDVLALTGLTITIARSLSDSIGSASDFQDFIDELQSLKDVLNRVAPHLSTPMGSKTSPSSASAATYPPREIEQCRIALDVFHNSVKKYEEKLRGKGPKSWLYKMLWVLWKKDQITDFRLKLARHRQAITMLQVALLSEQLSRNAAVTDIPPSMKNTLANSIEFVDAVGTRVLFHADYCSTWKMLDGLLKTRFGDAPFGRFVQEGDYHITRHDGKQVIHPQEWHRVVHAGMVVEMSIILKQRQPYSTKICPICGYLNSVASPKEGWIDCLGPECNARFQVSKMDGKDAVSYIQAVERNSSEEKWRIHEVMHLRYVHLMFVNSRSANAMNKNPRPCGTCRRSMIRCDMYSPFSEQLCRHCKDRGLVCVPYVPITRVSRLRRPSNWTAEGLSPTVQDGTSVDGAPRRSLLTFSPLLPSTINLPSGLGLQNSHRASIVPMGRDPTHGNLASTSGCRNEISSVSPTESVF
ncbi:hypothetical protein BD410DRAFT_899010 [Rickenella mellea]|uniref:Zn(2)-C6 fungal-type domain-containing protein n=1 Tax=Rickenella mellea TaxID=50990 RepID=A0A4Y7Q1Y5_9AGAM|nr:hypothetical protein BD410DRAFT_899010 [Rickenella mellea]